MVDVVLFLSLLLMAYIIRGCIIGLTKDEDKNNEF